MAEQVPVGQGEGMGRRRFTGRDRVGRRQVLTSVASEEKARVLVVDDERSIVDYLSLGFRYEGFEVVSAANGREALELFRELRPDVVVLDRMLPDRDGLAVCRSIRSISDIPILMLSARGEVEERVEGLEHGADDYLAKPFKFEELVARVRALLRRSGRSVDEVLRFRDVELDPAGRRVRKGGDPVELTAREFDLLEVLMRRPGRILTREQILTQLWGYDFDGSTNVVEVHVSALRQKLGDADRTLIRTVRGVGYGLGG